MDNVPPAAPEGSLKALRFIFFAMMLILIGGAIFLFVTIYERNKTQGCRKGVLTLPVQEEAIAIHQEGRMLTLLTKPHNHRQRVTVFDTCSGKVTRRIVLHKR